MDDLFEKIFAELKELKETVEGKRVRAQTLQYTLGESKKILTELEALSLNPETYTMLSGLKYMMKCFIDRVKEVEDKQNED